MLAEKTKTCLAAIVFLLMSCSTVLAEDARYTNPEYSFSFAYTKKEGMSLVQDKEPMPQHGILFAYPNGEEIGVNANYCVAFCSDGTFCDYKNFTDEMQSCNKKEIESIFSEYYECETEFFAAKTYQANGSDAIIYVTYTKTDGSNEGEFLNILKSLGFRTDDAF